ncbi:phosphoadenylyl-sulfate reductase [Histidinibacterium aquaticum]|uniref:Adenosine 5'-phosphosulfate reductase n=1 Tax=Histidinibacterium aquaticum TaxID=2613962 RepID=A0A5J5GAB0_9RHOB|nr:phosphoadenylyl-sulfate reductase [Histidinibacterium aquaticum]KAA9005056.1 phosphoadenylyl-sulfate reductase [Histidinibacterium aquaticum]
MAAGTSESWPPGGVDPLIESLAADHGIEAGRPNVKALLRDPRLGRVAVVSSFGADSIALLHYISRVRMDWPVLFLETGKHFPETLEYVDAVSERLGLRVEKLQPSPRTLEEEDPDGTLWSAFPDYCCQIRKVFPLQDALEGYDTWISGRKRFQATTRHALPLLERDGRHLKINPFAMWSEEDISGYIDWLDLPRHPLVGEGYPSIGCANCTRRVAEGEDPRAGRWAHAPDKTECGIHLGPDGKFRRG